jgi:hypothetical protein
MQKRDKDVAVKSGVFSYGILELLFNLVYFGFGKNLVYFSFGKIWFIIVLA